MVAADFVVEAAGSVGEEAYLWESVVLQKAARLLETLCIYTDHSHRRPRPEHDEVAALVGGEARRGERPSTGDLEAAVVEVAGQHEEPLVAVVGCRVV